MKHTLCTLDDKTMEVKIDYRDVHMHPLDPKEAKSFPPAKRVY